MPTKQLKVRRDRRRNRATKEPEQAKESKLVKTAKSVAAFILATASASRDPRLFMWRELMAEFRKHDEFTYHAPVRDCEAIWKEFDGRLGTLVLAILRENGYMPVKVTSGIRVILAHGEIADVTAQRTDGAYYNCMPDFTKKRAYGFVLFPPDSGEDHPLLKRRCERDTARSANGLINTVKKVHGLSKEKLLSPRSERAILEPACKRVRAVVQNQLEMFSGREEAPLELELTS
jgi:hypothetical protein